MPRHPSSPASHTDNYPGSDIAGGGDEWEFLKAMERYQRRTGRRYPSWREVLGVLRALGYRKQGHGARGQGQGEDPKPPA